MEPITKLRRHRNGRPVWPSSPIVSATARLRGTKAAAAAAAKAAEPRTWTVTVACRKHRRSLTIQADTKPEACSLAIETYRAETKVPAQTSVLVTECAPADNGPNRPEAA